MNKEIDTRGHEIFNVENPSNEEEKKTTGASQQIFTMMG